MMIVKDSQNCKYEVIQTAFDFNLKQFCFLCVGVDTSEEACSFKSFLQNEVTLCRLESDKKPYKIKIY